MERNIFKQDGEEDLRCREEGCGKLCKSKAGLKIHIKRMHKPHIKDFPCPKCGMIFKAENAMKNHAKSCGGERAENENRRRCEKCGGSYSKGNIARHRRACTAREGEGGVRGRLGSQRGWARECKQGSIELAYKPCNLCGRMLSVTNMARHQRTCVGGRE